MKTSPVYNISYDSTDGWVCLPFAHSSIGIRVLSPTFVYSVDLGVVCIIRGCRVKLSSLCDIFAEIP